MDRLYKLMERTAAVCKAQNWDRSWSPSGCYLHLEVSEFIESLRGKGDSTPTEEAGDIFFVLLSMMHAHDIDLDEVLTGLDKKLDELEACPEEVCCGGSCHE